MDYAHLFRDSNGVVHAIVTNRPHIKRNGRHVTCCAKRIDETMQRIVPHSEIGRTAPITCEADLAVMTALLDMFEEDERRERDGES